jgi:hypothetical protein
MAAFVTGQYEHALAELLKANLPEWQPHQAFLAATYVKLDRDEDARRVLADLRRAHPGFTTEQARTTLHRLLPFQTALVDSVVACLSRVE